METEVRADAEPTQRRGGVWISGFLAAYSRCGNISRSAEAVGIDRKTVYLRRDSDPEFRDALAAAREDAIDALEVAARERALTTSDTLLIFLLKSLRRSVYGDKLVLDHTGGNKLGADVRARLAEVDGEAPPAIAVKTE